MKIFDNAIFFPAISIATHTTIMKNDWKVQNKSPRFYLNDKTADEQCFHHPYILTSAAHNYKDINFMKSIGINDLKKDINMVFGDSGGFQIAMGEIKDTPEIINKLYTWMEQNSTVAPIIDCPPWKSEATDISKADLDAAVAKTKKNVDALKNRPKSDVFWLNVIHGREYDHRSYWYNQVKDFKLNGWALGSLRKNAFNLLMAFCSLYDNGELGNVETCQLIHFFGISAARYIPFLIYLKHKMNKTGIKVNLSFDSSYATQNGGWGKYLIYPSSTGFLSYHLSNRLIGKHQNVPLPCNCPVCKGVMLNDIMNEKALKNEGDAYFYNVVQSHNVYMLTEYVKMLHSLIYTDCEELWATCFKSQQLKVFKVIDKMFEAPMGKAHEVVLANAGMLNKVDQEDADGSTEDIMGEFFQ